MHLPKIVISAIPHKKHRYETCGDYYKKNGELHIRVSKMNSNHEFLVALHELIEWYLIDQKGVTIKEIDAFDMEFEKKRAPGNEDEPGDDPKSPYYQEHKIATTLEKTMATYLGVDWNKYSEHVNSLNT
jgi:hypothetical protein